MSIEERIKQNDENSRRLYDELGTEKDFVKKAIADFQNTAVGTMTELQEKQKEVEQKAVQDYREAKRNIREKIKKEEEDIKHQIYMESNCSEYPNGKKVFDILWNKAWDDGHACGFREVYNAFYDLDDMVMDIARAMKVV